MEKITMRKEVQEKVNKAFECMSWGFLSVRALVQFVQSTFDEKGDSVEIQDIIAATKDLENTAMLVAQHPAKWAPQGRFIAQLYAAFATHHDIHHDALLLLGQYLNMMDQQYRDRFELKRAQDFLLDVANHAVQLRQELEGA